MSEVVATFSPLSLQKTSVPSELSLSLRVVPSHHHSPNLQIDRVGLALYEGALQRRLDCAGAQGGGAGDFERVALLGHEGDLLGVAAAGGGFLRNE